MFKKMPVTPRSFISAKNSNGRLHLDGSLLILVRARLIIIILVSLLGLNQLLFLLFFEFVPLNIVLVCHSLDLPAQRVSIFDQTLPFAQVKVVLRIELLLATIDSEVHGRPVADLAVMEQKPHVTAYKRRQTDQILPSESERIGVAYEVNLQ
jgi:hypothetical protein